MTSTNLHLEEHGKSVKTCIVALHLLFKTWPWWWVRTSPIGFF